MVWTTGTTPKRLVAAWRLCCLAAVSAAAACCPAGCGCSRDGLAARCPGLRAARLPHGLPPALSALDVSGHRLRAVDAHTFANLSQLQALDLSQGRITQVSESAFLGLPRLQRLALSENWLSSVPADAFPPSLVQLDLSSNPLPLPAAGPFLRADGIARLNLSHCAVTAVGDEAFSQLPSLVELDLRGNPLTELSPLAFLGLRQLFVDEGSLGDNACAVRQVVQDVVQVPRIGPTTEGDLTPEQELSPGDADAEDPPSTYDEPETTAYTDKASDGSLGRQSFDDFSSLFGPVPRDAADSNLFKGAPFQATGEVTVVYASDLRNLKDTLLVLGALAVLCFLLAAVQRAVDNARARASRPRCLINGCLRAGGDRERACPHHPEDADCFWWEADKPRASDLPPPYPYPPTYEDSLTVTSCDPLTDGATPACHQPHGVHQARRQPQSVSHSADA